MSTPEVTPAPKPDETFDEKAKRLGMVEDTDDQESSVVFLSPEGVAAAKK